MTVFNVTDNAGFTSALGAVTTGDTIELATGATFTTLSVPAGLPSGINIIGQTDKNNYVARVHITGATTNLTIHGLNIQFTNDGYIPLLYLGSGSGSGSQNGLTVTNNRIRCGYVPDSFADFDPTNAGNKYAAEIGDLAVDPNTGLNGIWSMCPPLVNRAQTISGDITFEDNDFEDGNDAFIMVFAGGASYRLRRNNFRRMYSDCWRIGFPGGSWSEIQLLDVSGNYFDNCGWAQPQDAQNPHGDLIQIFSDDDASPALQSINNLKVCGNVAWYSPGFRGEPQRTFLSDNPTAGPFVAPLVTGNALISRITDKGILVSNDGIAGGIYCYIYQNTVLTNPVNNFPFQNELYTNVDQGIGPSSPSNSRIAITQPTGFGGKNFVGRNFSEAITSGAFTDSVTIPNRILPLGSSATSYNSAFPQPADWNAVIDENDMVTAFTPLTLYQDYGAVRPGDTAQDIRDRWGYESKPYSSLPSYVGIAALTNQAVSVLVESEYGFIWAGGGSRTITPSAGLEWREADNASGLNATAWSASPGSVTEGKFLKLRLTTAATPSTTTTKTYTLGAETLSWGATTEANSEFPLVKFNGATLIQATSGGIAAVTSKYLTLLFEFTQTGTPGSSFTLFNVSTGSGAAFQIQILNTGRVRFFGPGLRADSPTGLFNGARHTILATWDTSQSSAAACCTMYVDGVITSPPFGTYTQDAQTDWDATTTTYRFGGAAAEFAGELAILALWPGQLTDINTGSNRDLFGAPYIGPQGEGPFGASNRPPIMLTGEAEDYNVGNPNVGTGQAWVKSGGSSFTDDGAPWPPVLQVVSETLTSPPYIEGQPIDFSVGAVGYSEAATITASCDQAGSWDDAVQALPAGTTPLLFTFTPDAPGTHTFSFANDIGYADPSPIVLSVENIGPDYYEQSAASETRVGSSILVTYTLDSPALEPVTITPAFTLDATFSPTTAVIGIGETVGTVNLRAVQAGVGLLSATSDIATIADPDDLVVTVANAPRSGTLRLRWGGHR